MKIEITIDKGLGELGREHITHELPMDELERFTITLENGVLLVLACSADSVDICCMGERELSIVPNSSDHIIPRSAIDLRCVRKARGRSHHSHG